MGKQRSLRSKAANLVSDFTTILLNPISDKPSKKPSPSPPEDEVLASESQIETVSEEGEGSVTSVEGPDTSSFTAFLYSLLKDDYFSAESEDSKVGSADGEHAPQTDTVVEPEKVNVSGNVVKESGVKRGIFARGRQTLGKAMNYAARLALFRSQVPEKMSNPVSDDDKDEVEDDRADLRPLESVDESLLLAELPDMSEPSVLLSEKTRIKLYASLPALVKGKKWVLLYSTCRHGISLATLYRRSLLCPGLGLLVVGDRGGTVFGGVVEAPLKPAKSRQYQGSNSTFLFTDVAGQPIIYRPTGANRYYTLCSPDFLALGGGRHFALYLDSDLLNGSSAASETYGNPRLSLSEDFEVKEVELWGFAYASKYEEILALSQNEAPGICRW